jgi:hypothetical protein
MSKPYRYAIVTVAGVEHHVRYTFVEVIGAPQSRIKFDGVATCGTGKAAKIVREAQPFTAEQHAAADAFRAAWDARLGSEWVKGW